MICSFVLFFAGVTFKVGLLLGVFRFVVNVSDNLVISVFNKNFRNSRRCPRDEMVKVMYCGIVESEFVLHSHFRANTLGNGMNHLILLAMD